ncbi:MAG: FAD-dependent oxidoreductase [Dehalococcoidia bacterium]
MSDLPFEKLFEPGQIGRMHLRNRIVMAPIADRFGRDGYVTEQQKAYYEARAKGGVGLIIVGALPIEHRVGSGSQFHSWADSDRFIPGLTELAEIIQRHGARAATQLIHTGGRAQTGEQPVTPSGIAHPGGQQPRALAREEIAGIVANFVDAACRVQQAGFDGIEIHACHGYLLSEFLSPAWNKRDDEYGGNVENRARFLIEVVAAVRSAVGPAFPLWCRFNCAEPALADGITLADAAEIGRLVQAAGVDAIHLSSDPQVYSGEPGLSPEGFLLPLAKVVKQAVDVPVIAPGWITPELGEKAVRDGEADLIAIGRALIADPELANKLAAGQIEDIVPCIRCNKCLGERKSWDVFSSTGGVQCMVNASVGREREYEIRPASIAKRVLVVGGGPGGLEAARVAAQRGHQVVLYERDDRLGGQLNPAVIPPYKEPIQPLTDYLIAQLSKHGVQVKLGCEVTPDLVRQAQPDVVIIATGVRPFLPEIPGVDRPTVVIAEAVILGTVEVGERVVVIGGGPTGCEAAELLASQGRTVTLVARSSGLATKLGLTIRPALLHRLREKGVTMLTEVTYHAITDEGLELTGSDGEWRSIPADTIVLAAGVDPNLDLDRALDGSISEVYRIGDCLEPRDILEAINEGARVGHTV